jgi:hypothetical protein
MWSKKVIDIAFYSKIKYVLNTTTNSKDAVFLDLELSNRIDRKFLRIKKNTIIFIKSTEF